MPVEGPKETPARRVARNSAALAASRVFELAAGLAVSVLVAGKLGVEGLGSYATGWAIFSLLAIVAQAGLREYITRELSREPYQTSSYITHLGAMAFGASILLAGTAVLIVQMLPYSAETAAAASIAACVVVPKVINVVQEATFLALGRAELELPVRAVAFVAYIAVTAYLLEAGAGVAAVFVGVFTIECVVTATYTLIIHRTVVSLRVGFDSALVRRLAMELRPYAASAALSALFSRPEIIVLSIVASEVQVGLYGAAVRLADTSLILIDVFLASVFPILAREFGGSEARFAALQAKASRAVLGFALPITALLIALSGQLLDFVFGSDFVAAASVLQILSLNVVIFSTFGVLWRVLVARGRQDLNVRIQATTVPIRLGIAVALTSALGAIGAAIAACTGGFVHCLLLGWAVRKENAPLIFSWSMLRLVAAAVFAGGMGALLASVMHVLAAGLIALAVYVAAAIATGGINQDDRALLMRAIKNQAG